MWDIRATRDLDSMCATRLDWDRKTSLRASTCADVLTGRPQSIPFTLIGACWKVPSQRQSEAEQRRTNGGKDFMPPPHSPPLPLHLAQGGSGGVSDTTARSRRYSSSISRVEASCVPLCCSSDISDTSQSKSRSPNTSGVRLDRSQMGRVQSGVYKSSVCFVLGEIL